ncbi:DUF1707 SHOCT-like domain-containing protein [Micromonospora aurantiaca (nom. illeg.)]|uniref:DUF1707 SHOCT-like domain-containing protein n=1 Tax=Micromonospora aurantiaca (nom. illeg.) TaxID=47850 RepID=UPI0035AE6E91
MSDLRASDRDREAVVARLGAAAGEGRLTLAELGDRSGQAYAAKTYRELDVVVADLPPARRECRRPDVGHAGLGLSLLALVGGVVWMPLFRHVDFGALAGAAGVVSGMVALRAGAHSWCRAVALLGLVGGCVGLALQVAWIAFHVLMGVRHSML